jgi:hypothetical protein
MNLEGQFSCRHCQTILGTIQDLQAHRLGGYCHLPEPDPGRKLPFTRKTENQYRMEAEQSNKKFKSQQAIGIYSEKK